MDIPQPNNKTSESAKLNNTAIIQWQAEEFSYHEKSAIWYLIFWLIFGILIGFSIFIKNIFMALLFSIFAIILFFYSKREPRIFTYEINALGIKIGENFYPYEKIDSFWILYYPPVIKELIIKNKKIFAPYLKIPLADENPNIIRQELIKYLKEELYEENLIEILARLIKF